MKETLVKLMDGCKSIQPKSKRFDDIRIELLEIQKQNNYSDLQETCWNIINDYPEHLCLECNTQTNFKSFQFGYKKFCNSSCANTFRVKDPEVRKRISASVSKSHQEKSKEYWEARAEKHRETLKSQSDEDKQEKKVKKSKTTKQVHENRSELEKQVLNEKISKAVKESPKAKEQRHQRSKLGQKALQDLLMLYSDEELRLHYLKQQQAREDYWMREFGVLNPMQVEEIKIRNHTKLLLTNKGNYFNLEKVRETNISSGYWIPDYALSDYALYCRKVNQITLKQPIQELDNFHLRGHANKTGSFHLDHRFSKFMGFKLNIPPFIIGNIVNLEMIEARNNLAKSRKCSLDVEELLMLFFKENLAISFVL